MSEEETVAKVRRAAVVRCHGRRAGVLEELNDGTFSFRYDADYLADPEASAVSLTLPRRSEPFVSDVFFPFFFGLVSEGTTRELQARLHKIDPEDVFGLLIATGRDAVGAVTVEETG